MSVWGGGDAGAIQERSWRYGNAQLYNLAGALEVSVGGAGERHDTIVGNRE